MLHILSGRRLICAGGWLGYIQTKPKQENQSASHCRMMPLMCCVARLVSTRDGYSRTKGQSTLMQMKWGTGWKRGNRWGKSSPLGPKRVNALLWEQFPSSAPVMMQGKYSLLTSVGTICDTLGQHGTSNRVRPWKFCRNSGAGRPTQWFCATRTSHLTTWLVTQTTPSLTSL